MESFTWSGHSQTWVIKRCSEKVTDDVEELLSGMDDEQMRSVLKSHVDGVKIVLKDIEKTDSNGLTIEQLSDKFNQFKGIAEETMKILTPTASAEVAKNLEVFITATRQSIHHIDGYVPLKPAEVANKIKNTLKDGIKMKRVKNVDGHDINSLLVDDSDDENVENKTLGHNVVKLSTMLNSLHRAAEERNVSTMFENEKKLFSKKVHPFFFENISSLDFMLPFVNSINTERTKKAAVKRKKDDVTQMTVLTNKTNDGVANEEVSITKELDHVRQSLKTALNDRKLDRINYYEFAFDRNSFSRTVENMFFISYLIRDKKIVLILEDGIPYLRFSRGMSAEEKSHVENNNMYQGIMAFSFDNYTDLQKMFKNRKVCIEPKNL